MRVCLFTSDFLSERSYCMRHHRTSHDCAFVLLSSLLIVTLVGCSIIPSGNHTVRHREQPITAAHQPLRVVQLCLDTAPFMPDTYFSAAANTVADRINQAITVNREKLDIYIGLITHDSFENDVLAFSVPGFPADPPAPPPPAQLDNPYANAWLTDKFNVPEKTLSLHSNWKVNIVLLSDGVSTRGENWEWVGCRIKPK